MFRWARPAADVGLSKRESNPPRTCVQALSHGERPPRRWRITCKLRPIDKVVRKPGFAPGPSPSQGEMLLLHHDPDNNWSLWSDSHRRFRVYKTRPVAAEAQRHLDWCPRPYLHRRPPPSHRGAWSWLCYAKNGHDWSPGLVARQRLLLFREALICLSYPGKVVVPHGNAPWSSGYRPGALLLS